MLLFVTSCAVVVDVTEGGRWYTVEYKVEYRVVTTGQPVRDHSDATTSPLCTVAPFIAMSGGFIPPPTSHSEPSHGDIKDEKPEIGPEPLLRLTSRQEGRLRDHLDGRLSDLERDSKTQ